MESSSVPYTPVESIPGDERQPMSTMLDTCLYVDDNNEKKMRLLFLVTALFFLTEYLQASSIVSETQEITEGSVLTEDIDTSAGSGDISSENTNNIEPSQSTDNVRVPNDETSISGDDSPGEGSPSNLNTPKRHAFIESVQTARKQIVGSILQSDLQTKIEDLKKRQSDFNERFMRELKQIDPKKLLPEIKQIKQINPKKFLTGLNYNNWSHPSLEKMNPAHFFPALFHFILPYFTNETVPLTNVSVLMLVLFGSSLGFISFLYFITLGYGVGVALPTLVALLAYNATPGHSISPFTNLYAGLVVIWGLRLSIFLLYREFINWGEWHHKMKDVDQRAKLTSKFSVWMSCTVFYTSLVIPCLCRIRQSGQELGYTSTTTWKKLGFTGIALQIIGFSLEAISDMQKSLFKVKDGNRNEWCHKGLFKWFTHPNYLGDGLFWVGTFVGGLGAMEKVVIHYICSSVGLLAVMMILWGAANQLDEKQMKFYGASNPKFIEYRSKVGFFGPKLMSWKRKA